MDLIIRNARLRNAENLCDIGIDRGVISRIAPKIEGPAQAEIDAAGNLTCPPFCDPHLHLDAALSGGKPRHNDKGTLLEGIAIWGERKAALSRQEIVDNAKEAALWELANGTQFIRTHADVTAPGLVTLEALLEVKDALRDMVDIQIVAFPQDGIFAGPGDAAQKLMARAMDMGADVVGGIPHGEITREDGIRQIEYAFALAEEYDALIDIHCDETGDDQSRFIEVILKQAFCTGLGPKVTAGHTTAMHNYNNDYALKLIRNAARAKVNFITNPLSNSVLGNRTDGYPRRRGHTRVDELDAAGVNVCIGHDNLMDPWYPMGTGSMLQAANLLMHTAHMSGRAQIPRLFSMITDNSAVTMQIEDRYGIAEGKPANLLILDAADEFEALRLLAPCLYVIRNGRVVLTTKPAERHLHYAGLDRRIDFKLGPGKSAG